MNMPMAALGSVINMRNVFLALALVALVLFVGYTVAKNKGRFKKGGRLPLVYEIPGKTAAACRAALGICSEDDLFSYKLEAAENGGWYITFTQHNPTGQVLATMYLMQFEGEAPARISLKFVREAFGQRESIIPEELLDAFFAAKLGAVRLAAEQLDNEHGDTL